MAKDNDNGFSSGMLGLMFGFVAGAVAVILADPENREKVVQTTTKVAGKAKETIVTVAETIKEGSDKMNNTVKAKIAEIEEAVDTEIDKTEKKEV